MNDQNRIIGILIASFIAYCVWRNDSLLTSIWSRFLEIFTCRILSQFYKKII